MELTFSHSDSKPVFIKKDKMLLRKSNQIFSYQNVIFCAFIVTINISVLRCDSSEIVTGVPESTEVGLREKSTARASETLLVKSQAKDIYIVFNDTTSTEQYVESKEDDTSSEQVFSNEQEGLKSALVPTLESQLSVIPLTKQHGGGHGHLGGHLGHLGGHGHGGHGHGGHGHGGHNKIKIKKPKKPKKKHKKHHKGFGFMKMFTHPYMLIPQLIMLGFSPLILANLKMLVMHALMINNMALSTALFMLMRNMVFGPAPGPKVKYHNLGYNKPSITKHYIPPEPPIHHPHPHPPPSPPSHPTRIPYSSHSHVHNVHHPPPSLPTPPPKLHSPEPQFNIHALTQESFNKPYSNSESNAFLPHSASFSSQEDSFKGYDFKDSNKYRSTEVDITPSISNYYPSSDAETDHHALVDENYFKNDYQRNYEADDKVEEFGDRQDEVSNHRSSSSTASVDNLKKYSSMKAHASYRLSTR